VGVLSSEKKELWASGELLQGGEQATIRRDKRVDKGEPDKKRKSTGSRILEGSLTTEGRSLLILDNLQEGKIGFQPMSNQFFPRQGEPKRLPNQRGGGGNIPVQGTSGGTDWPKEKTWPGVHDLEKKHDPDRRFK